MSGHRRSVRLASADYAAPGLYFVTVVSAHRAPVFGRLDGDRVRLSDAGCVAHGEWVRTGDLRAGVVLDAFVVMPDHVHLLFGITGGAAGAPDVPPTDCRRGTACCALPSVVQSGGQGTARCAPTCAGTPCAGMLAAFGHLRQTSVPAIVRAYKSAVSRAVGAPVWQRGYHDRIVRTPREAENVRRYIAENPGRASAARGASALRTP